MESLEQIVKHPLVILVALALVGVSSLVNIKLGTDPHARPDPFTGTEGRLLEVRMDRQDRQIKALTDTVNHFVGEMRQQHPEQEHKLDRIIRLLERQNEFNRNPYNSYQPHP